MSRPVPALHNEHTTDAWIDREMIRDRFSGDTDTTCCGQPETGLSWQNDASAGMIRQGRRGIPPLGVRMRRDWCSETSMTSMARANLERLKFNHALTPGSY
jgi:hypothetical protein